MTNDEITTEDLLNMRVVPEQQADLAAVMDAFGLAPSLEGLTAEEQIANLTRQRDAWRHDALTAEQRIDALNERLADRDAQLDQAKTARARDLVRYSQDEMFLRLMAAEADRDAAEAALAQLTSITPLATPVGGQEKPNDVHKPFTDDGVTYCGWDGHEGCGEVWPCSTVRAAAPVGGQA